MSVLILSGSPIIGSFDFRTRVDFVRVPGVIKLRNGEYTSLSLHLDIQETLAMRASIIRHTAEIFEPDLFLVDKEPLGLRGEVRDTLMMLKDRNTPLILGLRDVMDEPTLLAPEWERKGVLPALRDLYDEIWVYGLPQICDPIEGIELPWSVYRKTSYTGYLGQDPTVERPPSMNATLLPEPFLLVTPGGGGDGGDLIDWVLRAYEADPQMPHPALIVFGPFMQPEQKAAFQLRVDRLPQVRGITFDVHIEDLMSRAAGVVAMGGYNTFCEILSFDKRALIVPRTLPRREQLIRTARAQDLGLVKMLVDDGTRDPWRMATALRHLPQQARPSDIVVPGLLDGLTSVNRLVGRWLQASHQPRVVAAQQSV
jgi:predicted glycosyltransferase